MKRFATRILSIEPYPAECIRKLPGEADDFPTAMTAFGKVEGTTMCGQLHVVACEFYALDLQYIVGCL